MGDSVDLGVSIMGDDDKKRGVPITKAPKRERIIQKIESLTVNETIIKLLLNKLKSYPDGALNSFWINLPKLIETMKQKDARNEI